MAIRIFITQFANIVGLLFILLICAITLLAFYGLIAFEPAGAVPTDSNAWYDKIYAIVQSPLLKDDYFHSILLFSIKQALLSALISTVLAWPIARAIYYLPKVYFKNTFLSLSLLCFVLPTLVLITGFVSLLGLSGILTPYLGDHWSLYGLQGILIAHVYMNLPFAVRAMHNQLQSIPDSSWQLSSQLKFSTWQKFSLIEWPAMRSNLSLIFGFITILCFNSFAVVLAFGGGPQSTTLEVAIYQALKYDFNISEALTLAWSQFAIAGVFFIVLYRSSSVTWLSKNVAEKSWVPRPNTANRLLFYGIYIIAFAFLLLPLFSLIPGIFAAKYTISLLTNIGQALTLTLALGLLSACVAMIISYAIMLPIRHCVLANNTRAASLLQWFANHTLIAPAMVLSVGLYILFLALIDLDKWGMIFVVLLNVLLILPFAIQQIRPRLMQYDSDYGMLYPSLKLSYTERFVIEWPYIKPVFLSTFSLTLLIAMGDVAIFSIFGSAQLQTLPWLIYQYAGSYRINEASFASAILLLLYLAILLPIEKTNKKA
jgi:thiamine transport system permease protein